MEKKFNDLINGMVDRKRNNKESWPAIAGTLEALLIEALVYSPKKEADRLIKLIERL